MDADFVWRKIPSTPVLFVFLAILWGGSFVAIEAGLKEWPPLLFAAVRYDLAGLLLLGVAVVRGGQWVPHTRDDFAAVAVVGGFVVFAHHAFLYVGQGSVPGPVAAAVVALAPVVSALLAPSLLGDEGLGRTEYAGVAVGFLGVVAVTNPGGADGVPLAGTALVFAATVAFAVGTLLLRRLSPSVTTHGLQGWGMIGGSILLHGGSRALGEPQTVSVSPAGLSTLAFLVVGPGVVAYLLYFRLLSDVGATRTMLVGYVEPLAAVALAFALFGYLPTAGAVAGFVLVLAGFALVQGHTLRIVADDAVVRLRTAFS